MKTPRTQLAKLVAQRSLKHGFTRHDAMALAAYLLEEGRSGELASLARDVQADWAQAGHVEVIAESAHELSPAVRRDIQVEARKLYPHAKEVIVTPSIQPDLIGGVRLNIIEHQLDFTTRSKLQEFKQLAAHGKD